MRTIKPPSPFLDPEKRYRTFNQYLRERFGCKVYKVSLDAGFTCPNRDGLLGTGGCTFCSGRGSASPIIDSDENVRQQMESGMAFGKRRYKAQKFMAYFQAFTNTHAPVEHLRTLYDAALEHPDVVGLAIGTRPDCVPDEVLALLESYTKRCEVWIEYGLQSIHDETLDRIERGHHADAFFDAVARSEGRGFRLCSHVVFGLPMETRSQMLDTIRAVAPLPLDAIKIHALHVIRGTRLVTDYQSGKYDYLSQEEYVQTVCDALQTLPPDTIIQRLTGETLASELIGPDWTQRKLETLEMISQELERRDTWQGTHYSNRLDNCNN